MVRVNVVPVSAREIVCLAVRDGDAVGEGEPVGADVTIKARVGSDAFAAVGFTNLEDGSTDGVVSV
jgi:hypothetical protein